ncbi:MAG: hypothetical protein Q9226_007506 [Calogaya cf. arnoldii]
MVAQQWVTVEVQRDDDIQQTSFDFTLHQQSLVVISLSQAGAQYDIAHAKALGWRQLRAEQAKKEREAAERRREARPARRAKRAEKAKRAENPKSEDGSEDDEKQ